MNAYIRTYAVSGLTAVPQLLDEVLRGLTPAQADARPDPERFTIREVVAHLADWEPIWRGRVQRVLAEDAPLLENVDEGELAEKNRYAATDVSEQATRFASERGQLVAILETLTPSQWERVGRREWGSLPLDGFASLILSHDAHHLRQILEQKKTA